MEAWFSIPNLPIRLMISKRVSEKVPKKKVSTQPATLPGGQKKASHVFHFSVSESVFPFRLTAYPCRLEIPI